MTGRGARLVFTTVVAVCALSPSWLGAAYDFSAASGDRVETAYTTHGSQRPYAVWAYRTSSGGGNFGRMFDKRAGADGQVELLLKTDISAVDTYAYQRTWSGSSGSWEAAAPSLNTWVNVIATYDSGSTSNDAAIYYDGIAQSITETSSPSGSIVNNTSVYVIGNRANSGSANRNWGGWLAEFAVWDRILTADEISGLGKGFTAACFPRGLVEYVPLLRPLISFKVAPPTATGTSLQPHPRVLPCAA